MENQTTLDLITETIIEQAEGLRALNRNIPTDNNDPGMHQAYRENAKTACELLMMLSNKQAAIEERIRQQARHETVLPNG